MIDDYGQESFIPTGGVDHFPYAGQFDIDNCHSLAHKRKFFDLDLRAVLLEENRDNEIRKHDKRDQEDSKI